MILPKMRKAGQTPVIPVLGIFFSKSSAACVLLGRTEYGLVRNYSGNGPQGFDPSEPIE
jgi:hypothetical protein